MKLTQAVKLAQRATGGPLAAYNNLYLHNSDGQICVTGSNGRIHIDVLSDLENEMNVCVDAKKFVQAVSKFGDDADIKCGDGNITLKSGKSRATLATIDGDMFPGMESLGSDATQAPEQVLSALGRVLFASAIDDVRMYLNGVNVETSADGWHVVATNGHRLAWVDIKTDIDADDYRIIIPRESADMLHKNASSLALSKKAVGIAKDLTITALPIDAKYIAWRRAVKIGDQSVSFNRAEMIDALGKVSIASTDKYGGVSMVIKDGAMTLTTNSKEDSAEAEITVGGDVEFEGAVMARYLLEAVNALESEIIEMRLGHDLMQPIYMTDGVLNCIVMPVRI